VTKEGVAIAVVSENQDPSGLGRVKVHYPWGDRSQSHWARVAVPMAGADQGTYFLPEIGQEVLVAFEGGDTRSPYVIGALWNATDKPPLQNSDGKNDQRMIRSRGKHELLFDDGANGAVHLKLKNGQIIELTSDKMRFDDGRGNSFTIQSTSGAIDIKANGHLTIRAAALTLEASGPMEIKSGATMTIRGSVVEIN
jgi:uncharacterized protein involved in type VI secretion and phage assembly